MTYNVFGGALNLA